MVRVRAGISYALTEAMDEGHCGLPTDELVPLAEKLLEVPQQLIRTALELELQEGPVVADRVGEKPCIFLAGLHRAERTIAHRLMRLANGTLPWPWIDPEKALPWVEKRIGFALAESQVAAIRLALMSKVLVMTGGPGVGKTTIVKAILRILAAKGTVLLLCAPTGRAAKRMSEAAGFEAKTIHRLLEVDPRKRRFQARRGQSARLRPARRRRSLHGRRHADAGAPESGAGQGGSADRRRYRPAPLGRAGPGSGGRYLVRCCAGGTAHRSIPAGCPEPDHHQRPSHQPGPDA